MAQVTLLTQAEYAKRRGCSAVAVHKAVKAGRISLIDGKIDPAVADIQWAQNTRARVTARPAPAAADAPAQPQAPLSGQYASDARPGDEDYWQSRSRREAAEASMAELKRDELLGDLIRVSAVRAAMINAYATLREAILNLPARLAPQLAAESDTAAIQTLLHAELHSALTTLAGASSKIDVDPPTEPAPE